MNVVGVFKCVKLKEFSRLKQQKIEQIIQQLKV
jgi:hypothetical protein